MSLIVYLIFITYLFITLGYVFGQGTLKTYLKMLVGYSPML